MNDRLVWIDCEMTGLDIERDALVEIACLVTDGELNLLDEGVDLIIKPRPRRWKRCRTWSARCTLPPGCSTSYPAGSA